MYRFTLLAILLAGMMIRMNGQITVTAADMPNIGDTIRYSTATLLSASGLNFAQTGTNHSWDFSSLTHASQDVDTFVGVISTPIYYYPSFITNASIARKGESFNMGTFSLTNVYYFYKETNTYFSQVGFAAQLNGIPLPTLYSAPDYQYRFPLDYGNTDSCNFGYNISIPALFNYNNQSKRVNQADGWGTITTPFGSFQALRVKSVITARDSISSDSLPFPIPPTTTVTTEYKWLAHGHRMPILTATIRGIGQVNVTYLDHYHPATGVNEISSHPRLVSGIFPNPAHTTVRVEMMPFKEMEPVSVDILTLTGSRVFATTMQGSGTIDVSSLQRGVYLIRVTDNRNWTEQVRMIKL
ncbi:MAG: T9SS type A sorting domain-containing protein [Bacteroidales bacterium]